MRIKLGLVCTILCLYSTLARAELPPLTDKERAQEPPPPTPPEPPSEAPPTAPVAPDAGPTVAVPAEPVLPVTPAPEPTAPAPPSPSSLVSVVQAPASAVHPETTQTARQLDTEQPTTQTFFPDENEKLWDLRTSMLFMERTHFAIVPLRFSHQYSNAYGEETAPLLFDATAALHLPITNRLSELLAYDAKSRYYNVYPYISLSFVPTVRMSMPSLDVLTPTYRVGANLQWFVQRGRLRGNPDHVVVHGVRLSGMHYSNGQGGCSFAKGQSDETSSARSDPVSPCRAAYDAAQAGQPGVWYRRNVDQHSGSFSTNYFALAYHVRRVWLARSRPDSDGLRAEDMSVTGGVIAKGMLGFANGEGQKDLYPLVNIRSEARYETVINRYGYPLRLSGEGFVEGSFLDQRGRFGSNAYTPWRSGVELAVTLPKINDLGLFAAVSGGQDPYNIHFVQKATWIQFGLVIDLFPRPRYGSGRVRAKPARL